MKKEQVVNAVEIIKKGGVLIAPTDSVYGLFGDALNEDTVNRIRGIKGRDGNKPFQIAVFKEDAGEYGILNETALKIMGKYWPGDVNIIVEKRKKVPDNVSEKTVCMTCHRNQVIDSLVRGVGKPLVSTSVNLSGMPPATRVEEIDKEVAGKVDLIVDGGETRHGIPNTIIDTTKTPAEIVREGQIKKEELENLIKLKQ